MPDFENDDGLRLDIWLWRARFFKQRSLASAHVAKRGVRLTRANAPTQKVTKAGFKVRLQDVLTFARAGRTIEVRVLDLGVRRGPPAEARGLYEEASDGDESSSEVEAGRTHGADENAMTTWINGWLERLSGDDDVIETADARLSATALLVEAALSDGIYADVEETLIKGILSEVWSLEGEAVDELLNNAEQIAEQAVDHHRFTRVIKTLPTSEREQLVEHLWRVVFADGEESPFEEAFVRRVADLMHVDDRVSRLARRRVIDQQ